MKFLIDTSQLTKAGYDIQDILLLVLFYHNIHVHTSMLTEEFTSFCINNQYLYIDLLTNDLKITPIGRAFINKLLDAKDTNKIVQINTLATTLQEIFPKGRKGETPYYWRGTTAEIVKKLISFNRAYPKITPQQIIDATTNYVSSFKNGTTYMQLLKYFIEKNGTSALAAAIENLDDHTVQEKEDWTSSLI